jgi:hypothetical protein
MADGPAAPRRDVAANRELWTRVNAEYADEHAVRAWAADEITWGIFDLPESRLQVLGMCPGLRWSSSAAGPRTCRPGWHGAGRGRPGST